MIYPRISLLLWYYATYYAFVSSIFVDATELPTTKGLDVRRVATDAIPIKITNACPDTIWPAFATQGGEGPSTSGFELASKSSKQVNVSKDWQGRVWGRTNCSFNADGTAASDGSSRACDTGDCNGILDCVVTGNTPVTLFEITLAGGTNKTQTFYDISLVDGYNLPIGLTYLPHPTHPLDIPPNLTNPSCIATHPHNTNPPTTPPNTTFPTPRTAHLDLLTHWCPWDLLLHPPAKPGNGIYPYPDDHIPRPAFSPCLSSCAATNSPRDCCTGTYSDPLRCSPGLYSRAAKRVCPDAYSYAFDDATSTFTVPAGGGSVGVGGWEVTFCPGGASSDILATFGPELRALAQTGTVTREMWEKAGNRSFILEGGAAAAGVARGDREKVVSWAAMVVLLAWACVV